MAADSPTALFETDIESVDTHPQRKLAEGYDALWPRFLAAFDTATALAAGLRTDETRLTGREDYLSAFDWEPTNNEKGKSHIARRIMNTLICLAEKSFAGDGARLNIHSETEVEPWFESDGDYRRPTIRDDFRPSAFWAQLEKHFGGDHGKTLAYQQAAAVIVDELNLLRRTEMRRVGGAVELEKHIYTEKAISGGGRHVSYHYESGLQKLGIGLSTFLAWTGREDGAALGRTLLHQLTTHCRYGNGFASRTRYHAGPFEIIYFYEKLVIRVAIDLAEQLNEFVGLYSEKLREQHAGAGQ